ncbi:MAG: hypothetical protein ACQGVK_13500 [Myxococcota bacterium]
MTADSARTGLRDLHQQQDLTLESMRAQLEEAELREAEDGFSPGEELPTWEDWREYLSVVRWLLPDVYRHARLKTLALLVLSSIGVGARGATVGTLLLYVHAQNESRDVVLAGLTLPSDASWLTFLFWGGAALGFALLTVAASYKADQIIFDLSSSYMESSTRRVLRYLAAGGPMQMPDLVGDPGARPVMRLLVGHTFRLVRVVLQTLSILLPMITLVAAVGVLVATNALLTAVLIPILTVYGMLLSRLNRMVIRDSQRREITRRIHSRDVAKMVKTLRTTRYTQGSEPVWLQTYPNRSWMGLALGAFRNIVLSKKRVDYLGDLFQGTALMMVLVVFGTLVVSQTAPWTVLLTYLVALGYATKAMGRCSKCVTTANRFIPQVRQYFSFIDAHPDIDEYVNRVSRGFADQPPTFRCGSPSLPESGSSLSALPGRPVLCGTPRLLNNGRLGEFCFALADGDPDQAALFDTEVFFQRGLLPLPERPIWEFLPPGDDRSAAWRRAIALFEGLGVLEEFRDRLGGPDGLLTTDVDKQLSPALRYAIRLMPALVAHPNLVVLWIDNLEAMEPSQQRAIFDAFSDRSVLVATDRPLKAWLEPVDQTMIVGEESVLGIGDRDWFERIGQPHLELVYEESRDDESVAGEIDDDEEEEDE